MQTLSNPISAHGRPHDFFPGMGKLGVWKRKSQSGFQGWSPVGDQGSGGGQSPQKPTTGCENNA